jgi:gliding motility-associated-like protein
MLRLLLCVLLLFSALPPLRAQMPAGFIENRGQWPDEVLFRGSFGGGDVYLLRDGIKYVLYRPKGHHGHDHGGEATPALRSGEPDPAHAVLMRFAAARPDVRPEADGARAYRCNFFRGSDPAQWASGVQVFDRVRYRGLYPGVDLLVHATGESFKYDLIVENPGRLKDIALQYEGAEGLRVENGALVIRTPAGDIREHIPLSYQEVRGRQVPVSCRYVQTGNGVRFRLREKHEPEAPLVIDPTLIFSTYSGSLADNWGFTATYDEQGNLYSGGIVDAPGYPTTSGALQRTHAGNWDVGILKYDSTGSSLLYATYLGGRESETPQSIIVNSRGELIVYGTTSSTDFPVTAGAWQPAFAGGVRMDGATDSPLPWPVPGVTFRNGSDLYLARISNDGTQLLSSTYIGGSGNDGVMLTGQVLTRNYGDQFRGEVVVDAVDNVYVASNTTSTDFPVANAYQPLFAGGSHDGVAFSFSPDLGTLRWSTFIGGLATDALFGVKPAADGSVYLAGGSNSPDFPVTPGAIKTSKPGTGDVDAVVVRISADGTQLLAGSYLGTDRYDQAYFIETDSSGRVYLLGQTQGDYPVTPGVYSNPGSGQFIHKLGPDLDTTFFSTVIGSGRGSPDISPTAFLVNECENILFSGWGGGLNSTGLGYIGGNTLNMPLTPNAYQSLTDGSDFYLMVLLKDARQLLYATYMGELGGRGDHVDGGTSRFDKRGIVYHSVCGSCGRTQGFPTTDGAWSRVNRGPNCNNAAFKFDLASLIARFDTDTPEFDHPGIRSGCDPLTLVFLNESIGGEAYEWNFGEGTVTSQPDSVLVTYPGPGRYPVQLTATDINTCVRESVARGVIEVYQGYFELMDDDSICWGDRIELRASGAETYQWEPAESLSDPAIANPIAEPDTTTVYTVRAVDANGCEFEDSVSIGVSVRLVADFEIGREYDCSKPPLIRFLNLSEHADAFTWYFGDGESSDEAEPEHRFALSDTFAVVLQAAAGRCVREKTMDIVSVEPFVPNFVSPNGDQRNDYFEVITDQPVGITIYNRWGRKIFEAGDYANNWPDREMLPGVYYYELLLPDDKTTCKGWIHLMK